jgi:mRNA-decapping enzyme subunit 2
MLWFLYISRFILNLPKEEQTTDRIFFHLQGAHWFYQDFYAGKKEFIDKGKKCPRSKLKQFTKILFRQCPFLKHSPPQYFEDAFARFNSYILKIPVYGAIILNNTHDKVLLVTNYHKTSYSFPKGKINQNESGLECAIREVWEETGINIRPFLTEKDLIVYQPSPEEKKTLYIVRGIDESIIEKAAPQARCEIGSIEWIKITDIEDSKDDYKFKNISPFTKPLRIWIRDYLRATGAPNVNNIIVNTGLKTNYNSGNIKIITNPRVRASSLGGEAELVNNTTVISSYLVQSLNEFKKRLDEICKDSESRVETEAPNPFKTFTLDKVALNECFIIKLGS